MGYSPWDPRESDTTERLHFHFLMSSTLLYCHIRHMILGIIKGSIFNIQIRPDTLKKKKCTYLEETHFQGFVTHPFTLKFVK